jgi:hypothetical protein
MIRRRDRAELRRLDRLSPEQRKVELDHLAAEALADPQPDVEAAVARVLDRRAQALAEQRERDVYDSGRAPNGRPCRRCGIESVQARAGMTAWLADGDGYRCGACDAELFRTLAEADDDRRVRLAMRLLGITSIPIAALTPHLFAGHLKVWWYEQDAPPARHPDARFGHVGLPALQRDWDAVVAGYHGHVDGGVAPPPPLGPCPACGVEASYRTAQGIVRCGACSWERRYVSRGVIYATPLPSPSTRSSLARPGERSPRDRDAAELLGLPLVLPVTGPDPLFGLAERVGFAYWAETGREPNREPWGHLDLKRMRRRAKVPA